MDAITKEDFTEAQIKRMYFSSFRTTMDTLYDNQEKLVGIVPDAAYHAGIMTLVLRPELKFSPIILNPKTSGEEFIERIPCKFGIEMTQGFIYNIHGSIAGYIVRGDVKSVSRWKRWLFGRDAFRDITDVMFEKDKQEKKRDFTMPVAIMPDELVYPLYADKLSHSHVNYWPPTMPF